MNFIMACIVMAQCDCMEAPRNQFLITACILIPSINDAESGHGSANTISMDMCEAWK